MSNFFDAANAPEGAPVQFVAGDFLQWKRSDIANSYPTATFSCEYVARITAGGSDEIKIAATETDNNYLFTVSSSTSAAYKEGFYHWQLEITDTSSGNRIVIDRGEWEVLPDLDVNASDPRTHAEIMLTKIESLLSGRADSDVGSYSIAGRSLNKMTFDELIGARDRYKGEVVRDRNAMLVKRGKASQNTIKVRF